MKPWTPPANNRKKCVHGTNGQRAEWFPRFLEEARRERGDSPQSGETRSRGDAIDRHGIRSTGYRKPVTELQTLSRRLEPSSVTPRVLLALPCIECQTGPYGAGTEHR